MKKIIIGILLFFAAVYLMLNYYFQDIVINKYPDKATVVQEKAIENGLIPALLPDSAYNIAETHDDEKGDLFGSFYYKEQDETTLLQKLKKRPEMKDTYEWGDFLFHIDTQKNRVKFRNRK